MRSFIGIAVAMIIAVALSQSVAAAEEYWIKVAPTNVKGFIVEAEIETNIPGAFQLVARLVYKPPNDEGGFIGTGLVRFPAFNGKGRVTIDGLKTAEPRGSKLPNGEYDFEVFYNYMWPDNTETTRLTKINTNIKGVMTLSLSASEAAASRANSEDGVRWVVENVAEGNYWDPLFWRNKFGDLEEVAYKGPGDPKMHKMYYIRSIHVTLLINDVNSTIIGYRMGLAHE